MENLTSKAKARRSPRLFLILPSPKLCSSQVCQSKFDRPQSNISNAALEKRAVKAIKFSLKMCDARNLGRSVCSCF